MAEYSYNGWEASPDKAAIGVVSSDLFPGGVKAGDVTIVLSYVARQFNARVEPLVDGWCWAYTYKTNANNPAQLSCHASGTAIDANAPDHPNGSGGTFTDAQVGEIYAILDEVQGAVNWLSGYDEMHFEICVDAADLAQVAALLGDAAPPTPPTDWFDAVTKDEMQQLLDETLDPIMAALAEVQGRLRGADTGPGERHELIDMLQSIDADTRDVQYRVRGADTGPGERHEHFDMLQGIDGMLS